MKGSSVWSNVDGDPGRNDLYPGATGDVALTITDPGGADVNVTQIVGNDPIISDQVGGDATTSQVTWRSARSSPVIRR